MSSENDKVSAHDFSKDYEQSSLSAMRELERRILGCDYGGTSWTTLSEAKQIAEQLKLSAGDRLLEVGAGSGWPGLLLASLTGCEVFLADIPFIGLRQARERASKEGITRQIQTIVASATALPFEDEVFDYISHSDVLCCLPAKLEVLRECRRLARANSVMMFSVIAPAPTVSEQQRRLAIDSGPPFVDVCDDYAELLYRSGWQVQKRINVTAQFARSVRAFHDEMRARADVLTAALGADDYQALLQRRQSGIKAIEAGLLEREVFVAHTKD